MRRVLAIARKELRHILRDPRSLAVAVGMPLMMVVLYGYGVDTELKNLPLGILDQDRTEPSRWLVERVMASELIGDGGRLTDRAQVETGFRRERFMGVLVIPAGYGEAQLGGAGEVQLLVDGADATTAATVENYLRAVLLRADRERLVAMRRGGGASPVDPDGAARTRVLFNPELESSHFIVPGLVAVILVMICALLTSIAITREKETGTMEQLLTTPLRPAQLVLGKVVPYLSIAAADAALVLAAGRIVFGVPMVGSWWVLAGYSLVYLMVALGLGLLISALVRTQRVAMTIALVATMLPTIILSGFVFDVSSMPVTLQALGRLIPATYYLPVIRGIMLTGRAWYPFEGGVLLAMAIFVLSLAVRRFGARIEP